MAYGKVDRRIWNDAKFRGLGDDGQLVFLMLLTHPHMTSAGAMRSNLPGLAAEKGWTLERFRKAFEAASKAGMAEYDEAAGMVAIPNYLKHNKPSNPNQVKGCAYALEMLPECQLKQSVANRCLNGITWDSEWLKDGLDKPFRTQEQEQEIEQQQEKALDNSPAVQQRTKTTSTEGDGGTKRRTKLELTELPAPWAEIAKGLLPAGADSKNEFAKFRDHHVGKGTLAADWPATWRTWCRKATEFAPRGARSGLDAQRALEARNEAATANWKPPVDDAGTPP